MAVMICSARAPWRASATIQRPSFAFSDLSSSGTCFRRKLRNHATGAPPQRPRASRTKGVRAGPG
eukprot:550233-Lingulodinium_polyedra.AAC.1